MLRPDAVYSHERMGLRMLELLVDENAIDLESGDRRVVEDLIMASDRGTPKHAKEVG